jgi:hypothetical protein
MLWFSRIDPKSQVHSRSQNISHAQSSIHSIKIGSQCSSPIFPWHHRIDKQQSHGQHSLRFLWKINKRIAFWLRISKARGKPFSRLRYSIYGKECSQCTFEVLYGQSRPIVHFVSARAKLSQRIKTPHAVTNERVLSSQKIVASLRGRRPYAWNRVQNIKKHHFFGLAGISAFPKERSSRNV